MGIGLSECQLPGAPVCRQRAKTGAGFAKLVMVLAVVLASFLLTFLAEFWEPAKTISFLSLLNYYRPALVFQEGGAWPLGDMIVLLAIGGVFWTLGGVIFERRDICTV